MSAKEFETLNGASSLPAEFFPTPPELIAKMVQRVGTKRVCDANLILEPSAGKGDIPIFLKLLKYKDDFFSGYKMRKYLEAHDIDDIYNHILQKTIEAFGQNEDRNYGNYDFIECIESDPILRDVLTGREISVVDDDFLAFDGESHYDFIFMNPPFSNGDEHLLHAIHLAEKTGSEIVCILNSNTIKNPYTNTRKLLLQKISEHNASYEFIENAFSIAERPCDVEVAIIHMVIPSPFRSHSRIWEELDEKTPNLSITDDCQEIVTSDTIMQVVLLYKKEIAAGKKLIEEYLAIKPYLLSSFETEDTPSYARGKTTLTLTTGKGDELDFNKFVHSVRYKYWHGATCSATGLKR